MILIKTTKSSHEHPLNSGLVEIWIPVVSPIYNHYKLIINKFSPNTPWGYKDSFYIQTRHENINAFVFLIKNIPRWNQAKHINIQIKIQNEAHPSGPAEPRVLSMSNPDINMYTPWPSFPNTLLTENIPCDSNSQLSIILHINTEFFFFLKHV